MEDDRIFGRGISFPPHLGPDGRVAWSSGPENVRESIRIILLTERGERLMLPQFGADLRGFLHEPNTVATQRLIQETVLRALQRWEPRIEVESVDVELDPTDPRAAVATIYYRLLATRASDQVGLRIQLES